MKISSRWRLRRARRRMHRTTDLRAKRREIITIAGYYGLLDQIPGNWNKDGTIGR